MAAEVFILTPYKEVIFPGERHTRQRDWENIGVITAVVAGGEAPIDADKKKHSDIVALADAKKAIYEPQNGTVNLEFRFRADGTLDDVYAMELYAEAGIDHYTKISDLGCKEGLMEVDDGSQRFISEIADTNEDWETSPRVVCAEPHHICRYILNAHGHTGFLFVCTDIQSATHIWIDVRRAS